MHGEPTVAKVYESLKEPKVVLVRPSDGGIDSIRARELRVTSARKASGFRDATEACMPLL